MDEKTRLALAEVAEAATHVGERDGNSAFAEAIVESIEPNHLTFELINQFLPTRQLQPGDSLVRRVRTGFKARTMTPGM